MWTSLPLPAGASSSAGFVMSNAELTAAVLDLGKRVAEIHAFLMGQPSNRSLPPLPAWLTASSTPIYTSVTTGVPLPPTETLLPTTGAPLPTIGAPQPTTGSIVTHGGVPSLGVLSDDVERPLFHGSSLLSSTPATSPSVDNTVFSTGVGQAALTAGGKLHLCIGGGLEGVPLPVYLFIGGSALPNAAVFRRWPPRERLRWPLLRPVSGGHPCAPLSPRWRPWDPGGCTCTGSSHGGCPTYLQELEIKSCIPIPGQNNKLSRDVKGLFLGVKFEFCRVIRSQLEDELLVQVGCSVREVKGLLGLSPLGLIMLEKIGIVPYCLATIGVSPM